MAMIAGRFGRISPSISACDMSTIRSRLPKMSRLSTLWPASRPDHVPIAHPADATTLCRASASPIPRAPAAKHRFAAVSASTTMSCSTISVCCRCHRSFRRRQDVTGNGGSNFLANGGLPPDRTSSSQLQRSPCAVQYRRFYSRRAAPARNPISGTSASSTSSAVITCLKHVISERAARPRRPGPTEHRSRL